MADQEATKAATDQDVGSNVPSTSTESPVTPVGAPGISVTPATAPELPAGPPSPFPAPSATATPDLGNDIAKILADVKLLEHRDAPSERKPIENKAAMFDTALGSGVVASPAQTTTLEPSYTSGENAALESRTAPGAPLPQSPQHVDTSPTTVHSVHTLKDDLQNVVRDEKISVVRAVSLEEDRRAREKSTMFDSVPVVQKKKRGIGILFSVLLLLLLGGGALLAVYVVARGHAASPSAPAQSSILFAESAVTFPIDNQAPDDLKRTLASARAGSQGALGSITEVIPTVATTSANGVVQTRPATFAEFMNAMGAHPSDELIRALSSNFFFGIHTVDKQAPLFVIPVISYEHAFAGMLAWESSMNADLAPVFTAVPALTKDANGLPVERTFQDLVMRNYDTRALEDDSGQVELYYSFPTQNLLVIAESPYSFTEILSRLQAAREL